MLTAVVILSAARTRGIFAVPTRAGEVGPVLLASIGVDTNSPRHALDLFAMRNLGEIELIEVAPIVCKASLYDRGLDPKIYDDSCMHEGNDWRHALLVEAVAETAERLTDEQIATVHDEVTAQIRAATSTSMSYDALCRLTYMQRQARVARGEKRARRGSSRNEARARVAAAINHRRGVLLWAAGMSAGRSMPDEH